MPPAELFGGVEDDTRAAIMQATYDALCEHGYANLTIQRIADEFPKSKSLLYHHYDGKDDLLLDFLDFLLTRLEEQAPPGECTGDADTLEAILERIVPPAPPNDRLEFLRAITELRAQATHDPAYREHFTRSDAFFRNRFRQLLERAVDDGAVADIDTAATATVLVTVTNGSMLEAVTTEGYDPGIHREALESVLEAHLLPGSDGAPTDANR
ncbi:MAG: TetR/AcrR family transcriptional regulator [Halodesulfurarchaeum sp.]